MDSRLCEFLDHVKRTNPYTYKHYHNVVDGMTKPNTLFALCSHYIQENILGARTKDVGFTGSEEWQEVNTCYLKYLVENF